MKRFTVYEHDEDPFRVQAVKQGFSWPAFFFGWIWAFAKRMPGYGSAMLAIAVGFFAADEIIPDEGLAAEIWGLLWLAYSITIGAFGNSWRENSLEHQGYESLGVIEAGSVEEEIQLQAAGADRAALRDLHPSS